MEPSTEELQQIEKEIDAALFVDLSVRGVWKRDANRCLLDVAELLMTGHSTRRTTARGTRRLRSGPQAPSSYGAENGRSQPAFQLMRGRARPKSGSGLFDGDNRSRRACLLI
jgi:hypothetical protein